MPGFIRSLDETLPLYAIFFQKFGFATAHELVDYLDIHYTPIGETQASDRMGKVIL